jgi:transketolase
MNGKILIKIDSKIVKLWSRLGPRAVYGQLLLNMAKTNKKLIALSSDLGRSSGLGAFSKELPDQFFNVGIAEQNLIGVSSGLARQKFNVFASTFAPFASLRASEQVRMNMGYMQEPVKLIALASGFALGFLGNSHFGIEDIAVMRAIPGITIISPADCAELYKCLIEVEQLSKPVYIRLTGGPGMPIVYEKDYDYQIGKAVVVKPIKKINVISHGTTVGQALKAIENLEDLSTKVGLVNMHTIKPLDKDIIKKLLENTEYLLIFEEHTLIGGLGSAILELINDEKIHSKCKIYRYGVKDNFPKTGNYNFIIKNLELDAEGIKATIKKFI